ncbi:carbon storage regulator [Vreelandella massiliensis]|uniref:carbon storage regulator n=1 Tax=Vreelandella massiliensis TaxID=1816686 RepID=UPI00096A9BB4|nr:carbon storage regulator [Halomonas massiliensis]
MNKRRVLSLNKAARPGRLVITRKHQESVQIGDDVTVTVIKHHNGDVRLSIEAPRTTKILRTELSS